MTMILSPVTQVEQPTFLNYFASVGPKLANKLPTVQRNYFDFLNRSNSPDSLFAFNLVTPAEVELDILRIPINKSHGLYSCHTQLLKHSSNVISSTLEEIINLSVLTGMYPTKLKMAKMIPIKKQILSFLDWLRENLPITLK